jgi:integrase
MGNDYGGADQRTEAATDSKARDASLQCGGSKNLPESCAADDVRNFIRPRRHTGMRPGEYIGLKWQDVDWERGTVSVKRTLRKGPAGQWEYGETKRAGSRRLIRLQNWIIARLKELKEFQAAHPVVDPEDWPESVDLIFITEFGRPMNVNSLVYKHFKPILKRAALPEHQTL